MKNLKKEEFPYQVHLKTGSKIAFPEFMEAVDYVFESKITAVKGTRVYDSEQNVWFEIEDLKKILHSQYEREEGGVARDPERISGLAEEIGLLWRKTYPDWRFGQLMVNFFGDLGIDPFFLEEKEFLVAFRAFCQGENPKAALYKHWRQEG